ncbi:MAG TPA: glycosyltransferase [Candidatus Limnocylindria bacterium]|nr:glycosyltransferase [Candidatus Limnocylindria bacterium]
MSVIVPSHNRRARLERLLIELERHHREAGNLEVIVAVDGSNDGTVEMLSARRAPYPLRVIAQPRRGPAAARNAAIAAARGDLLLFLDDDVRPQEGLFERHLAFHRANARAAAIGRMAAPREHPLPPWLEWEAALLERQYARMQRGLIETDWRVFYTANASVPRDEVIAAGGFDERFVREEDIELASRLASRGVSFKFLPDAVVHHVPDRTFEGWLAAAFERGRHDLILESNLGFAERSLPDDWRRRHPLSRTLTRWCVGHEARTRLVVGWLRSAMVAPAPVPRRLLCSALFSVKYWAGVAEASGLRARLWRDLIDRQAMGVSRSAMS